MDYKKKYEALLEENETLKEQREDSDEEFVRSLEDIATEVRTAIDSLTEIADTIEDTIADYEDEDDE